MSRPDIKQHWRAGLFCGLVVALGWGIRGEIGGPDGAVVPGALLGMALAITSGRDDWIRRAPVLGMAGALGFALGGSMSYGLLIGYTRGTDLLNVAYGYAMLGIVGGLWGAFGAGCLAMAASPVRYRVWQVLTFVAAAIVAAQAVHWLLVDVAGLRANPGRGDAWAQCLGAVLALLGFTFLKHDNFAGRMVFWGFSAGSAGFMIGELFQIVPSHVGPAYDWWKVMEQMFGFILGAGVSWAIMHESRGVRAIPPPPYALTIVGLVIGSGLVCMNAAEEIVGYFARENMQVLNSSEKVTGTALQFRFRELVMLALIVPVAYAVRARSGKLIAPDFAAKLLFSFVMWFCVMVITFKKSVPEWEPTGLGIHTGFLMIAVAVTLWLWYGWPVNATASTSEKCETRLSLRVIAPIYLAVVLPALVLTLAAVSIATHPGGWDSNTHKRFGEEPPVSSP